MTASDVDRARTHVHAGLYHVETLERDLDVDRTADELRVTLELDAGQIVGNIDHLTVTDDCYYVTDYKTDSLTRADVDDRADHYWPQLHVYACALQQTTKTEVVLRLVFARTDETRT